MIGLMIVVIVASLQLMASCALYGYALLILYPIAALIFFIPTLSIVCELASSHPVTGGSYVWVEKAFGKSWGFFTVSIQWLANLIWYPTIFSFIASALAYLFNPDVASNKLFVLLTVLGLFWSVTFLNMGGIRLSALTSSIGAVGGVLFPILLLCILGAIWLAKGNSPAISFSLSSSNTNFAVLTQIVISLTGLEMALVHMGDVEHSRKTIPRALFIAGAAILLIVIAGPLIIAQVLPPDQINVVSGLLDTFATLFQNLGLAPWLFVFVLILIFAGNWGNVTAWMISSTRGLQVASQSCSMPKIFTYTNRHHAPVGILLLEGIIFTCFALIMGLFPKINDGYWFLLILASQIALIYYWLIFAAALRLRKTHPPAAGLYRVPGKNWGIWIAAILGTASTGAAVVLGFFPPNETIGASFPIILFGALTLSFLIPAVFLHLSKKSLTKLNSEK